MPVINTNCVTAYNWYSWEWQKKILHFLKSIVANSLLLNMLLVIQSHLVCGSVKQILN